MKRLFDTPIRSPDDDDLGRLSFAKSLSQLIDATPREVSTRFAVYGEWGEGKTSVMELVARELASRGHAIAWFTPWMAESPDDAWHALLVVLAAASGADKNFYTKATYQATRLGAALSRKTAELAEVSDYTKPLRILAAPFEKGGRALLKKGRDIAISDIRRALGERRLTVLVDDLDRVDAKIVPRLLMSFRETFDLPGFSFVLGLSPSLIEEGLRQAGYTAGDSSHRFLEKIVEYPHYLPPMTDEGRKKLIARAIKENPHAVRAEPMEALLAVLPSNPRRLKIFLRHLLSFGSILERFSDDEISWPQVYAALLLRLEFASETYNLIGDDEALKELSSRELFMAVESSGAKNAEKPKKEEAHAPQGVGRDRFLALCAALAEHASWHSERYTLRQVLTLPDDPPLITWQELNSFFARITSADAARIHAAARDVVCEVTSSDAAFTARARALFQGTTDLRDAMLDHALDVEDPSLAGDHLKHAELATTVLHVLAVGMEWFQSGTLDFPSWRHLYEHCLKWSRYTADAAYGTLRVRELDLLRDSTVNVPNDLTLDIASVLFGPVSREDEVGEAFAELLDELRDHVGNAMARHLVAVFERPDGIDAYLNQEWNWRGRNFLFDPDSPFHQGAIRSDLDKVAAKAAESPSTAANFLLYFQMLVAGAFERALNVSSMETQRLLRDEELLRIVWRGLTARPLSLRAIGSLIGHRKTIASHGGSRGAMPIPASWSKYADAFPDNAEAIAELKAT
jgi:hypothetical protein